MPILGNPQACFEVTAPQDTHSWIKTLLGLLALLPEIKFIPLFLPFCKFSAFPGKLFHHIPPSIVI